MTIQINSEGSVHFAHHLYTEPYNIGDNLCAPYHYFNFSVESGGVLDGRSLVVGGGTIPNADYLFDDLAYSIQILWAVGDSIPTKGARKTNLFRKLFNSIRHTTNIRRILARINQRRRLFLSTRDPSSVSPNRELLPCVSCLHDVCDQPIGDGFGIVINEDPRVSGDVKKIQDAITEKYPYISFKTNSMDVQRLLDFFSTNDRIITNSYHIAYWTLLNGKRLQFIGYSSKSEELLRLFSSGGSLRETVLRGSDDELLTALLKSISEPHWIELDDAREKREFFRTMNREYARKLTKSLPGLRIEERKNPTQ